MAPARQPLTERRQFNSTTARPSASVLRPIPDVSLNLADGKVMAHREMVSQQSSCLCRNLPRKAVNTIV